MRRINIYAEKMKLVEKKIPIWNCSFLNAIFKTPMGKGINNSKFLLIEGPLSHKLKTYNGTSTGDQSKSVGN